MWSAQRILCLASTRAILSEYGLAVLRGSPSCCGCEEVRVAVCRLWLLNTGLATCPRPASLQTSEFLQTGAACMIVSFIISAMSVLRRDITCTLHTQTPPCNTPHADSLTPYVTTHVLSQKPRESIEREAAATLLLQAHAKLIVIRTDRIVLLTATLLLQCALRCKPARSKQRAPGTLSN